MKPWPLSYEGEPHDGNMGTRRRPGPAGNQHSLSGDMSADGSVPPGGLHPVRGRWPAGHTHSGSSRSLRVPSRHRVPTPAPASLLQRACPRSAADPGVHFPAKTKLAPRWAIWGGTAARFASRKREKQAKRSERENVKQRLLTRAEKETPCGHCKPGRRAVFIDTGSAHPILLQRK